MSAFDKIRLRDALNAAFNSDTFPPVLDRIAKKWTDYVAVKDTFPTQLLAVVNAAVSENWLRGLVTEAWKQRPTDPELSAIAKMLVVVAPPAGTDVLESVCLIGGHVLADRRDLRSGLGQLLAPRGKRILVVKDEKPVPPGTSNKSGKSHSVQLISYLGEFHGGFEPAFVNLIRTQRFVGPNKVLQPWDIGADFIKRLSYDVVLPDPPIDGQWSRWNIEFCDNLEKAAKKDPTMRWLVVDEINLVLLPQQSLDLIKELAGRINVSLGNLRLILIGYTDTFEISISPNVADEAVTRLKERELIEFFSRAYKENNLLATTDDVADAVDRALNGEAEVSPEALVQLAFIASQELDRVRTRFQT